MQLKTPSEIKSYRSTGYFCSKSKNFCILSKMLCHIALQTASTYFLICLMLKNEKYEYLRNYIERTYGKSGAAIAYAVIIFFQFPGMLLIQNSLAKMAFHFCSKVEARRIVKEKTDFIEKLKTNYSISNSLTVFYPSATKVSTIIAYFFYLIPLYLLILMVSVFNTSRPLCSTLSAEFLLNNKVQSSIVTVG